MTWADRIICQLVLKEGRDPAESIAMFRTAAALLAKKTAIVAITGVTVIGGATFALAEIGQPPGEDGACDASEVLGADGLCAADIDGDGIEDTSEEPCTDDPATETNECATPDAPCTDDPATETDECATPDEPCTDDPATETDECATPDDGGDGLVPEHPENHGKYVSEAAKGGGECAGLSGQEKGQCVARVAKSDAGKAPAEDSATTEAPTATETVLAEPAPAKQATPKTQAAPTEKPGKGNGGGAPAGKGGKKG